MSLKETLKQAKRIDRHQEQQVSNAVKPRNYLALNPLLQKGGIHEKEDIDCVRKKRRRETKQSLRQTDWLAE